MSTINGNVKASVTSMLQSVTGFRNSNIGNLNIDNSNSSNLFHSDWQKQMQEDRLVFSLDHEMDNENLNSDQKFWSSYHDMISSDSRYDSDKMKQLSEEHRASTDLYLNMERYIHSDDFDVFDFNKYRNNDPTVTNKSDAIGTLAQYKQKEELEKLTNFFDGLNSQDDYNANLQPAE